AVKKLRYGAGFFESLFPAATKGAAKKKGFAKALKRLQGALGALNDLEAHKRIAGTIADPPKPTRRQPQKALAMGFIAGREQADTGPCLDAAAEATGRLAKARPFWT